MNRSVQLALASIVVCGSALAAIVAIAGSSPRSDGGHRAADASQSTHHETQPFVGCPSSAYADAWGRESPDGRYSLCLLPSGTLETKSSQYELRREGALIWSMDLGMRLEDALVSTRGSVVGIGISSLPRATVPVMYRSIPPDWHLVLIDELGCMRSDILSLGAMRQTSRDGFELSPPRLMPFGSRDDVLLWSGYDRCTIVNFESGLVLPVAISDLSSNLVFVVSQFTTVTERRLILAGYVRRVRVSGDQVRYRYDWSLFDELGVCVWTLEPPEQFDLPIAASPRFDFIESKLLTPNLVTSVDDGQFSLTMPLTHARRQFRVDDVDSNWRVVELP